jgi:hypothetical protein
MSRRVLGPNVGAVSVGALRRPHDVGARDDHGAGATVVADRQVLPVRQQRLGVGTEQPTEVRRVVLRGVEVDVVGDRERQVQRDVGDRVHRGVRDLPGHQLRDPFPDLDPPGPTLGHERVERRFRERGVGPISAEHGGQVDDAVPHAYPDPRRGAGRREHAVGQVVGAERGALGDEGGHRPGPRPDQLQA